MKKANISKRKKMTIEDLVVYLDKRFATKEDLSNFATKEDLSNFATKEDLSNFATKEDLSNFPTKEDLSNFPTKEDLIVFKDAIIVAVESFNATTITASDNLQFDNKQKLENHEFRIRKIEGIITTK